MRLFARSGAFNVIRLICIVFCLTICSGLCLTAQEKPQATEPGLNPSLAPVQQAVSNRPENPAVTVEWVDKPLRSALEIIGEIANVNLIIDLKISNEDTVTVTFRNLEWRLALDETVSLAGCTLEEVNPSLFKISKPPTISMDFKDAPLDEVIRNIAKLAGVNIILAEDVKGTVTIILSEVPWLAALNNIIKTAGYSLVQEKNDVYRVVRTETLREQLETRVFQLKYLRPPSTYKATISTPYAVGKPKAVSDSIKEFTLLDILRNMLSRSGATLIGSLDFDLESKSIIVKDTKVVLDAISKVLDQLDVAPQQVLIELKFISTDNEDILNLGLKYNWSGTGATDMMQTGPYTPNGLNTLGSSAQSLTSLPFGFGNKLTGNTYFLNSYDVNTVLRLFKGDTKSKFLQEPTLLALDGEEATVFVGEEIRYADTKVSYSASGIPLYQLGEAANSPVNVGFQLWVMPDIVKDSNKIMMTVIPSLEDLSGKDNGFEIYTIAGQTITLPRIRQSTVVTRLLIESGQTAVIGGMADERLTKSLEKIPLLGDIPLISLPFRYNEKTLV